MNEFLTEEALFEALKARDSDAQTVLHEKIIPGLSGCSFKIVKDKELAQDIAKRKFWDCLAKIDEIKNYRHLVNTLFKATKNRSLNYVRDQKGVSKTPFDPNDLDDMPDPETTNEIIQSEVQAFVREQIAQLSGINQVIAQRAFIEGWTSKDLANLLKVTRSSIDNKRTRLGAQIRNAFRKK